MHPYSDPLDHGRIYNQSRLKSRGGNQQGGDGASNNDFLQPEDPVRPRSVGYGKGHVRNLLKLDVYGEGSSEEARAQREMGLLPPSPNIDRYRHLGGGSRGTVSTASTASSSEGAPRRPRTTGHTDSLDVYLPLEPPRRTLRIQEGGVPAEGGGVMDSNSFAVLGIVAATPEVPDAAARRGGKRGRTG
jgi:hypothetical protein